MEPHVKERIVGAAILVALGVWLIPWVLDGPDEARETTAAADEILPAAGDAGLLRTETVELDPAPLASERARLPGAGNAGEPEPDESVAGAAADTGPDPAAPAESRPNSAAAEVPARAAPSPSASANRDGWAVQLGAFGEIANANQLASRVSTYGYTAYVSEFRSGGETMHRVRVGGFESEKAAEAAASSLSAHGFPGRVISPE